MPKKTIDHTLPHGKPGTPEAMPSQNDAANATPSNNAAGAESQAAPTASDSPGDTATGPVKQDAFGNPEMPGQTTDANPSPAGPGTAISTSPNDDTPEAGATKDEAGEESEVPAAPSNSLENNLPLTADGDVEQPAKLDGGGCFEAIIPQDPAPSGTPSETRLPAPAADENSGDAELAQPSEILPAPVEAPRPPPRVAMAVEVFNSIKCCFLAQTHLPGDAAEFVALWVISNWFQDALTILPCLVITGPAPDGRAVLHVLRDLCLKPVLLAGFRRSDLRALYYGCKTSLVSEPSLDKRSAELLSNLTDRNFRVAVGDSLMSYARSTAIYAGENPATHQIENAIHIHIPPGIAAPPAPYPSLRRMVERVRVELEEYHRKNSDHVLNWTWTSDGLSSETTAIATELGRCIVDAPELRQKLLALLKTEDKRRRSELSNTPDAVVLEATRTLCRDGREHAYSREIAAAANLLFEARGEVARLSPELAGHSLKRLGLPTHSLSKTGNGLTFDRATIEQIDQVCAARGMEDKPAETENLHGPQTTENN